MLMGLQPSGPLLGYARLVLHTLQMEEARRRTVESDAARAAEVKARSAPGRPANGAQHEDDNVSSTSGASTERSHQSAAPAAHGRMEGPGKAPLCKPGRLL